MSQNAEVKHFRGSFKLLDEKGAGLVVFATLHVKDKDNDITLPSAGTYLLIAQVAYIADSAGALDNVQLKLRNSTDSTDVGTTRSYAGFATISTLLQLTETVTVTAASKVIQIHAVNNTSARGVIDSVQTTLHYVRLH